MTRFDVVIRGGIVVGFGSGGSVDIGISDGLFAAFEPEIEGSAAREIDATGKIVLPGVIDPHVHFNEPGRTDWEGWASGSAAAAVGGTTVVVEMPLNAHPPTLNRASFDAKVAAATASSYVDFGLWGGLTPDSLATLSELDEAGVIGLKAFMSASGTDDFRHADLETLKRGMEFAAGVGLPVAVHAEDNALVAARTAEIRSAGRTSMRDYLASRPIEAEVAAIGDAIAIAEETGCQLHVVHVSSPQGVALVTEARLRGVDVTCETCPHYLAFTNKDAEAIGPLAKCAPPLRDSAVVAGLWERVLSGELAMVTSDHSPAPPSMKTSDDAFANWGGISGCQHLLTVMATLANAHGLAWEDVSRLLSTGAAARFRLQGKGGFSVGSDADVAIVTPQEPFALPLDQVRYRHPASAWDGYPLIWRVTSTLVRGVEIARDGEVVAARPAGRLLTPAR